MYAYLSSSTLSALLIHPNPISPPIPTLTVHVQILHTRPHTRLQQLRIPLKHPHYRTPTQTRKYRPRISSYPTAPRICYLSITSTNPLQPSAHPTFEPDALISRLETLRTCLRREDQQFRKREHHACEDVYDDLLVYAGGAAAEDEIARDCAGEEGCIGGRWRCGGRDVWD